MWLTSEAAHGSGHDLRLTGSGRAEPEIKPRPAWGAVAYSDAGAVRSNDFHDDRQPKPGAVSSRTLAAPETVEDARAVVQRYTRPAIQDAQCILLSSARVRRRWDRHCRSIPDTGSAVREGWPFLEARTGQFSVAPV